MDVFSLRILTPDKAFCETQAHEIVLETPQGRMGVRAGHMPMIAAVTECVVNITTPEKTVSAAVSQGFAEISGSSVDIYVDTAEWSDEIDAVRARRAYERAQMMLKSDANHVEYMRSQAAMARALARLKAASARQKKH